jgi:hypothetical protein
MTLAKKNKILFPLYLAGIPVIFFISLYLSIYYYEINLKPLIWGFLFSYIITIIYTVYFFGYANFYLFFTLLSAFFIYDAFFFSLFKGYNFLITSFPIRMQFKIETGFLLIILSYLLVYIVHIFYIWYSRDYFHFSSKKIKQQAYKKDYEKIGVIIMLIFFIPVVVKLYIQFKYVIDNGYLSIFRNELQDLNYPFWTTGSYILFSSGYFIYLSSFPLSKIKYVIISIIFLFVVSLNSLKGQRGPILFSTLAVIIWYNKIFLGKIKTRQLINIVVIFLVFSVLMGNIRNSYGNNNSNKISSKDAILIIKSFFYGQSISRTVPMLIIEKNLKYHNYPFIFSPIASPLLTITSLIKDSSDTNIESELERENNISSITMYYVSKERLLMGNGYGSSVIAEFYDFGGIFGYIILCIILSFLLTKCDHIYMNKRYRFIVPLIVIFSFNVIGLARNRLFGINYFIVIFSILVSLLIPVLKTVRNKL